MTKIKYDNFEKWNDDMFARCGNEDRYFHKNPLISYVEKKRVKVAVKLLNPKNTDKILEVGCGAGYVIRDILKKASNAKITGVDLSETALNSSRKKFKSFPNVNLKKGNAENLSFLKEKFNKIICTEVIEHVEHPEKVIDAIMSVAAPSASIILTVPDETKINFAKGIFIKLGLFKLLFKGIPKNMEDEWHLHHFDKKLLKKIIKGKMKIVKTGYSPWFIFPMSHIVKCRITKNLR